MSAPVIRPGAGAKAARVRLFLLDVDGVLTDGGIVYDGAGTETKRFHVRDGHGIVMLRRAGVETGIITGRTSATVDVRARELGIPYVRQGAVDKVAAWREILAATGLRPEETAYVGDDIVDLPVLRKAGFSAAVADAEERIDFDRCYINIRRERQCRGSTRARRGGDGTPCCCRRARRSQG